MFRYLQQRKALKKQAHDLYGKAVGNARQPFFYTDLGVPDSFDGRFEVVALHCAMIIHGLNKAGETKQAQALFDVFFKNMEQTLREQGVGDVGIVKHMKRMMQGFNGRAQHFEMALKNKDRGALIEALKRNVYGTVKSPKAADVENLAAYVEDSIACDVKHGQFAVIS